MPTRPGGWGLLVPVAAAGAGLLFVASAVTAHGTDLRASRTVGLAQVLQQRQRTVAALMAAERRLQAQVSADLAAAAGGSSAVARAGRPAAALGRLVGLDPVRGAGLTVTLDDAPKPTRPLPGNPTPDDLVVHQQDVQAVVNALWAGGARAVSIMGERLASTTAVKCVGNTLLLRGTVYSPPYVVAAVGAPAALQAALDASPDVQVYRQYVAAYQLGYRVSIRRDLTIPGYGDPLTLSFAKASA